MTTLFDPVKAGALDLANRIVMAPLTRNRSPNAVPGPLAVDYYAQRASAGLLITEATAISHQGQGYADVPGLYAPEQLAGWRKVTDAVHAKGGKIVVQLWHVGRISHNSLQPNGGKPVAPSAIRANSKTYLVQPDGTGTFAETSEPRALETGELSGIVTAFAQAAKAAVDDCRLRRRRTAWRERLSHRPVPALRQQSPHGQLWRFYREPRALPVRGAGCGDRGCRRRPHRHPALAGNSGQRCLRP